MFRNGSNQSDTNMSQQHLLMDRQNSEATICSANTVVDKSSIDMEGMEAHTSSYLQVPERYDEAISINPNTTRRRRSTSLEMLYFDYFTDTSLDHRTHPTETLQPLKPE